MRASSSSARARSRRRAAGDVRRRCTRVLDLLREPELELAGGGLGEGHRDDAGQLGATAHDRRDDAVDQRRRLPGAGRRLDDQRGVEVGRDAIARRLIGERRHRSPRSVRSSWIRGSFAGLRCQRVSS